MLRGALSKLFKESTGALRTLSKFYMEFLKIHPEHLPHPLTMWLCDCVKPKTSVKKRMCGGLKYIYKVEGMSQYWFMWTKSMANGTKYKPWTI